MTARCVSEAWSAAGKRWIPQVICTGVLMSRDPRRNLRQSPLFLALISLLLISFISAVFICIYLSFSLIAQGSNVGILFLSASVVFGFYSFKVLYLAANSMVNPSSIFGGIPQTASSPNKQLNSDAQKALWLGHRRKYVITERNSKFGN